MNNEHTTPKLTEEELSQVTGGARFLGAKAKIGGASFNPIYTPDIPDDANCRFKSLFTNHDCTASERGQLDDCPNCPGNPIS